MATKEELEALYGEPLGRSLIKEIDHISDHYRAFVEATHPGLLEQADSDLEPEEAP